MHILFTRPLEDCEELILKFRDLGHKVSHMPVIQIEKVEYEKINFLDYKAIIFTSANSLKFLNTKLIDKKIICFCVGRATEKKALNMLKKRHQKFFRVFRKNFSLYLHFGHF